MPASPLHVLDSLPVLKQLHYLFKRQPVWNSTACLRAVLLGIVNILNKHGFVVPLLVPFHSSNPFQLISWTLLHNLKGL